ncbi:MAG TPA: DUF1360 domain-containing protein [Bellilinea sp.]|nr:DUF1360 domain-containing protein [Bellilinea sp.]
MPQDPRSKQQESITKILLSVLFMGGLGLLAYWVEVKVGWLKIAELELLDIVLIGIATFRLGRMIAFDRIMDPLRVPFSKVVDDNSGEGKTVVPRGSGFRQAMGQLIVCPACVGTWVAAVLVALMLVYPAGTRIFLYATAAVGIAELLHSLTEVLCWTARQARTSSGYVMEKKKALKEQNESHTSHSQ